MKNKKFPLISIIILNYNGLKYLRRTIPLVLNLDYCNYETIVVDNGSSDGSLDYLKTINNIKLIVSPRKKEKGSSVNYAIKFSSGEKLLLLDNDILIKDKSTLTNLLNNLGEKEVISPILIDEGNNNTKYYGGFLRLYGPVNTKEFSLKSIKTFSEILSSYPNGGAIFINKMDWDIINGYDENQAFYLDDLDLGIRLWTKGYKIKIVTSIVFTHIGGKDRIKPNIWCEKYKYYFSGYARSMIKTYSTPNLTIALPSFFVYSFAKTLKQALIMKSVQPFFSLSYSYFIFLKNILNTYKTRQLIQAKRNSNQDSFLKIKLPTQN